MAPVVDATDTASDKLIYTGMFTSTPGEMVTGKSNIYQAGATYNLVLDSFSTTPGPDLHVYLSAGSVPDLFIDLGKLRSDTGTQVYSIPGKPDFSVFTHVLVHCVQYNHIFGISELE